VIHKNSWSKCSPSNLLHNLVLLHLGLHDGVREARNTARTAVPTPQYFLLRIGCLLQTRIL
jgi:hypothetical protein